MALPKKLSCFAPPNKECIVNYELFGQVQLPRLISEAWLIDHVILNGLIRRSDWAFFELCALINFVDGIFSRLGATTTLYLVTTNRLKYPQISCSLAPS